MNNKNIDESIGYLTSLKKLDLSKNQPELLPRDIFKLVNLEELNLSENKIG